jgi:hypothetical protein
VFLLLVESTSKTIYTCDGENGPKKCFWHYWLFCITRLWSEKSNWEHTYPELSTKQAVEKQYVLHFLCVCVCVCVFVCSFSYPACKAHAPCYIVSHWLSGATTYFHNFLHYLTDGTIFGRKKRKLSNLKWVFWFSQQLLSEILIILRRIQRDIILNVLRYLGTVAVILVTLKWRLNFLNWLSKKYLNITLHENPSTGSTVVPCGRTDIHGELVRRFSQFCKCL